LPLAPETVKTVSPLGAKFTQQLRGPLLVGGGGGE